MCSNRCANPVRPGRSFFEPTWYQRLIATSGAEWSSLRTTRRPLSRWYCSRARIGRGVLSRSSFILLTRVSNLPWRHIAIEGPIGVGKTSLTNLLAKRFRGTKVLEDAGNPFLDDFYKDKRGAAFRTELFFLLSRFDQQRQVSQRDLCAEVTIADYTFQKSKIFAYLTLDDSELMIYNRLYELLNETVP